MVLFFFFLRELSFRGRGRNKTPAIHTTYLVFIPFLQVQRPPSAFRPAAPITFSSHSPALYDFPAGLHFTLTHPSFVPSLFLSRRISIQAPPPILQRIPFSQIIPKTRQKDRKAARQSRVYELALVSTVNARPLLLEIRKPTMRSTGSRLFFLLRVGGESKVVKRDFRRISSVFFFS